MSDLERVVVVLALVVMTGLFTLAEYALVTTRRWRMQELASARDRRAATVLGLMNQPLRFIGTIQLGISALGILVGALGEPVLAAPLSPAGLDRRVVRDRDRGDDLPQRPDR